jgi:hypothetical protein
MMPRPGRSIVIVVLAGLFAMFATGLSIFGMFRVWRHPTTDSSDCQTDQSYRILQWKKSLNLKPETSVYEDDTNRVLITRACIQAELKSYIDSDYGEVKDLAKAFLTLLTATFLASITFSEKIVRFETAPRISSLSMFVCWGLLLLSIFSCGIGLSINLSSLFDLKYDWESPAHNEFAALVLFFGSGIFFALGLAAMVIAALPLHIHPMVDNETS